MSTISPELGESAPNRLPVAPEESLPDWLKLTRPSVYLVVVIGLTYWYLACLPLWHSDVWLQLKYGEWIWANRQLPETEVFMPLAEGVPYTDSTWLSQLLFYGAHSAAGLDGIRLLYSVTLTAIHTSLLLAAFRTTGRMWLALLVPATMLPLLWPNCMVPRPQLFGALLFVWLVQIACNNWQRRNWFLIPLIFLCWVNLHGSFLIGLAVLGCCVVGRAIDAWRTSGKVASVLNDPDTRRWLLVSELSIVACLANPYGLELFRSLFALIRNQNLRDILEWQPLSIRSMDGIGFVGSIVVLFCVFRLSRRAITATETLLLVGFGIACMQYTRSTLWWGLLTPYVLSPHVAESVDRYRPRKLYSGGRSLRNTVLAAAIGWILFAYSPPGLAMIHHRPRKLESQVSRFTPIATADFLREHPPSGPIFHPLEWGDWLAWYGPEHLECMLTSHIALVPEEIWRAYQRITETKSGWELTLDGLGIRTLVIDKVRQGSLLSAVRESASWRVVHEDRLGVVAHLVDGHGPSGDESNEEHEATSSSK